jgi:hypothetical protein
MSLKEWLFDETKAAPDAVANFRLSETTLRTATTRRKALYAGFIALTVGGGAKDFHTAQKLTPARAKNDKIESHHVFPKAHLAKSGASLSSELILNRALIDQDTNRIIGENAPSKYVADIAAVYSRSKVEDVLSSHLIDGLATSPLISDEYAAFIAQRCDRSIELIEEVSGGKVTRDWAAPA